MTGTTQEIVIRNGLEEVVARMYVKDSVLHGHCEWYDGQNNLIAYGFFNDGAPMTGTFLNWTRFFSHLPKDKPYEVSAYGQDWVTVFETCFASEPPKYEMVIEAYHRGEKLSLSQS